jgi:anti-sigma regulatory factor (Ser/Thr protein kinase)
MTQELMTRFTGHDAGATAVSPAPRHVLGSRLLRLAALPSSVPWARRVLRHMLCQWQLEAVADPALLLLSELVTNAVQASSDGASQEQPRQQMICLTVQLTDASLVIRVWDANPALPVLQEADVSGDHGRGLLLVDFLAGSWGHYAADGGKVVWCELAIPVPSPRRRGLRIPGAGRDNLASARSCGPGS